MNQSHRYLMKADWSTRWGIRLKHLIMYPQETGTQRGRASLCFKVVGKRYSYRFQTTQEFDEIGRAFFTWFPRFKQA